MILCRSLFDTTISFKLPPQDAGSRSCCGDQGAIAQTFAGGSAIEDTGSISATSSSCRAKSWQTAVQHAGMIITAMISTVVRQCSLLISTPTLLPYTHRRGHWVLPLACMPACWPYSAYCLCTGPAAQAAARALLSRSRRSIFRGWSGRGHLPGGSSIRGGNVCRSWHGHGQTACLRLVLVCTL